MAAKRDRWMVKFLLKTDTDYIAFAEGLRYAGMGRFEPHDGHNVWFLLYPPKGVDTEIWAMQTSVHFEGMGFDCCRYLSP